MKISEKMEARPVAKLLDAENQNFVGLLYLWENGETDPLWINERPSRALMVPLPGEDLTDINIQNLDQP